MTSFMLAFLLSAPAPAAPTPAAVEWSHAQCAQAEPGQLVAKDDRRWLEIWALVGKPAPMPRLGDNFAVAVFLGVRDTGGYGVRWGAVEEKRRETVINVQVTAPSGITLPAMMQPCAVRLFPGRPRKAVRVAVAPPA